MFLPMARRNKEKETSDANRITVFAVGSSAIWDNLLIYSPVKLILFTNPGGFRLACSDTALGEGKNPNVFVLFPELWLLSCAMEW